MTTTPPILTGEPPEPEYCGNSMLPTVRWSIRMLQWVGWVYDHTDKIGRYRTYSMTDPGGYGVYLSTYGLRREAMKMHIQYGLKAEKNFDLVLDNEPGF